MARGLAILCELSHVKESFIAVLCGHFLTVRHMIWRSHRVRQNNGLEGAELLSFLEKHREEEHEEKRREGERKEKHREGERKEKHREEERHEHRRREEKEKEERLRREEEKEERQKAR